MVIPRWTDFPHLGGGLLPHLPGFFGDNLIFFHLRPILTNQQGTKIPAKIPRHCAHDHIETRMSQDSGHNLGSNKKMVKKNDASLMSFCEDVFCWLYGVPPMVFLFGKYSLEERLVLNFFVLGG